MRIVILGGGLTGLSAAYHLEQNGFFNYTLFEKEDAPGGLCRSVHQDGFTFDYTGHLLHCNNSYFEQLLHSIGFEHFNTITRDSWIYSKNRYTKYPFQSNLKGLPFSTIVECILGFIGRPPQQKQPATFSAWVDQQFGPGINRHFFSTFQEKLFAYNINKISASWTGRFVPKTTLLDLLYGAFFNSSLNVGYNAKFIYPKSGGINFFVEQIAQRITNKIAYNFNAQSIDLKNRQIIFANGHREKFDQLISTIPLKCALTILHERSQTNLRAAASKLLCNAVVNFNIGIKRENLSTKHWIYFPEKLYPFYRLGFSSNFSDTMAPTGHSSLYGEFSYLKNNPETINNLLKISKESTKRLLGIQDHEILTEKIITIPHAYVIFTPWRDRYLPKLLQTLEQQCMHSVGRYGAWKYSSMQEAVLDGKLIAENLLKELY